jgi:hypothetical protein
MYTQHSSAGLNRNVIRCSNFSLQSLGEDITKQILTMSLTSTNILTALGGLNSISPSQQRRRTLLEKLRRSPNEGRCYLNDVMPWNPKQSHFRHRRPKNQQTVTEAEVDRILEVWLRLLACSHRAASMQPAGRRTK